MMMNKDLDRVLDYIDPGMKAIFYDLLDGLGEDESDMGKLLCETLVKNALLLDIFTFDEDGNFVPVDNNND